MDALAPNMSGGGPGGKGRVRRCDTVIPVLACVGGDPHVVDHPAETVVADIVYRGEGVAN